MRVPCGPAVQIVAFFTSTTAGSAGALARHASLFPITAGEGIGTSVLS